MTTSDPGAVGDGADTGLVRASGACVWRPTSAGEIEVLLVHRPKYDDWSLPKGKLDAGEHPLACAVREVAEETGHRVVLGRPLPVQRYFADGRPKLVQYWAARADDAAAEWAGTQEIDRLDWVAAWQVAGRLSHPRDVDVVRALAAGPPGTVPLVVLRHAEAIQRRSWAGEDTERPLSAAGEAAADALVPLLAAYGITRIVSSDTERCTASVAPYGAKAGVEVELERGVCQEVHEEDPEAAPRVLRRLLADGVPTVLSTHRPVVPTLQAALEESAWDGVDVPSRTLRTAEMLVAHHARGIVVAVEAQLPPTP